PLSWPVTCLPHSVVLQSQQWLYATHWNTVTIRSSSYSHFLVFLALFTASCKVRGRSGWSNWYGQVLQWQGGGQVGERNPAPRVDERNGDFATVIGRMAPDSKVHIKPESIRTSITNGKIKITTTPTTKTPR